MTETLNSIYLRLNVDMQNLASKAIAQITVKLVYANEGGMTKSEIMGQLAKVNQRIALVYVEGKGEKAQVTGYTFFDEMLEKAYSGRLPEYSLDF